MVNATLTTGKDTVICMYRTGICEEKSSCLLFFEVTRLGSRRTQAVFAINSVLLMKALSILSAHGVDQHFSRKRYLRRKGVK